MNATSAPTDASSIAHAPGASDASIVVVAERMPTADRRMLIVLWAGAAALAALASARGSAFEFAVFVTCFAIVSVPGLRMVRNRLRIGTPRLVLDAPVRRGQPATFEIRLDDARWAGREVQLTLRWLLERHVVDGAPDRTELAAVTQRVVCEADPRGGARARALLVPHDADEDPPCDPMRERLHWELELLEVREHFAASRTFEVVVRD
ncbi:MAG: hypothetical protein ACOYLX_07695 [Burkholderiaceae bacterium]|jgi:hypothetical protein